jgi:23S rRNA (guanosine2251-2'-O)-methyltransferase
MARPSIQGGPWLYGIHAVAAAWVNPQRQCKRLLVTAAGLEAMAQALTAAGKAGLVRPQPETIADRTVLDRLLPQGAVHQGVVLETAALPEVELEDIIAEAMADSVVVVLDQVTDPHNVGAVLRSAAAFGAAAVIVTDRHAPEATATLAKTASGALEVVPLVRVTNLARALTQLQAASFWCVGLAEEGKRPLHAVDLTGRSALVMGAEGSGLRRLTRERCDEIVHLPTGGSVGSLNVSNAAAVALYEVARRR